MGVPGRMKLGPRATQDVVESALKVVAAFKDDPVREQLHPVQVQALNELENACRFLYELVTGHK